MLLGEGGYSARTYMMKKVDGHALVPTLTF